MNSRKDMKIAKRLHRYSLLPLNNARMVFEIEVEFEKDTDNPTEQQAKAAEAIFWEMANPFYKQLEDLDTAINNNEEDLVRHLQNVFANLKRLREKFVEKATSPLEEASNDRQR